MNRLYHIPGILLAMTACSALGDIYTLNSTSTISDFRPGFDGGNQFPFIGLNKGDPLLYHFEYEIDTPPATYDGNRATWEISGSNSYAILGSTQINFDRIKIFVHTSGGGWGGFNITGYIDEIGVSAGFDVSSPTPVPLELPTSIDPFIHFGFTFANSEQNLITFPIVQGYVETASIIPAPASSFLIFAGFSLCARRRTNSI